MRSLTVWIFAISASLFLIACTTGNHGSFVSNTYIDNKVGEVSEEIVPVTGQSCQTKVLYVFPLGLAPSTHEALQSAKDRYAGTKYLTDVSIDDRVDWKFGYSIQCITVQAMAHR